MDGGWLLREPTVMEDGQFQSHGREREVEPVTSGQCAHQSCLSKEASVKPRKTELGQRGFRSGESERFRVPLREAPKPRGTRAPVFGIPPLFLFWLMIRML